MLSFLSPLFLAGAAAAAIPLVLHLLKREPEPRVLFAAVKLLKHAPIEHSERRHLRELLLLALRVAALLLLALAFARPFFASGEAISSAGATLVAIDTSASMSAPGQFDRARQLAKDAIGRAPAGDLVGVLTFADVADLVARPSADRALALSAIDGAAPGFGATRYRAALSAAAQALGGRHGTIVIVTDLQESGWDAGDRTAVPESARIEVADVGEPPQNLAVTAIRSDGDRVIATVRNAGAAARETRVRLTVDGRTAGETTASIGANQSTEVPFAGAARATTVAVTIEDRDGVQADIVRYAVLENSNRAALLVVTATGDLGREAFYVQQALAATAVERQTFEIAGVGAVQLSTWPQERLVSNAAVLLLSTRGLERRGREALAEYTRNGGGLLIAAGPDIDGEVVGDVLGAGSGLQIVTSGDAKPEPRALAPADVRHPIFQTFGANAATLGLVKFHSVARIAGSGCQTLARFTTGEPALLDCAAGEGRAVVIASDLNDRWNDFPLHATFVPFLHEAVRYLAGGRPRVGDYLVSEVPAGVPPTPGIATLPDPRAGAASRPRRVAVNVDPRESDPARLSVGDFQSTVTRLKDVGASEARFETSQQEERQHLWEYVLTMMIALLAVEGVVASRTA
jgi:Aerotolerance regulator N-terminal/von Willebrand factor type A domain